MTTAIEEMVKDTKDGGNESYDPNLDLPSHDADHTDFSDPPNVPEKDAPIKEHVPPSQT